MRTISPKAHMSIFSSHAIPNTISGALYRSGMTSTKNGGSPKCASPKSEMIGTPG